ncbi:Maf family protein [Chitinimonas lacunae]|uniref:dTTP/UTP pyrophosphatase n=1 Tax=Chitinimonas lacunae TaxID=1963018 RepID=A0ABV8MS10_9NEIS
MTHSNKPTIYLASASPRRGQLLTQVGIPFERLACDIDETPHEGEAPAHYVVRLAREKAAAALARLAQSGAETRLVLAADTTVTLDGEILGKPADAAEARAMLSRLSGKRHQAMTGVAVAGQGRIETALSISDVTFRPLEPAEIDAYVASGEPMDKAGAYGLQGLGSVLVAEMRGSFSGVIGLPLSETVELLRRMGYPFWG